MDRVACVWGGVGKADVIDDGDAINDPTDLGFPIGVDQFAVDKPGDPHPALVDQAGEIAKIGILGKVGHGH